MGLSLEFLIGNDKKIVKAAKRLDFDLFEEENCVLRKADFSLHIEPRDLDTLSIAVAKYINSEEMILHDYLDLVIDKSDHGLFTVHNLWVKYFSELDQSSVKKVTGTWFQEMQKQYKDEGIEITDEGIKAVNDLVVLCKDAIKEGSTVFHFWYL
jgi:hypothetical protein